MDFSQRNTEVELMDNPTIEEAVLRKVLKDINRANRLLGGNKITIHAIAQLMKKQPKAQYTIVDMGCGDGSMLRAVALFCRKRNIEVRLIGLDLSEQALAIGKEKSRSFPEIQFVQHNIIAVPPTGLVCDILLCTLTMHHFNSRQIPQFLEQFVKLASIGVIINDLQRSRLAYYLFKAFSVIFIQTWIAKHDGLLSIKSGFVKNELIKFSRELPHVHHSIQWKWAFRYIWVMYT